MKILRNKTDYYYISSSPDLSGEFISPKIPVNKYTRSGWIDTKTKRIILYPDVSSALIGTNITESVSVGSVYYIYSVSGFKRENIYTPNISDIPWAGITKEKWCLSVARLQYLSSITVTVKSVSSSSFHSGPRSSETKITEWSWKENLQSWEKQGKLK